MTVYILNHTNTFPPVEEADEHGILAVGGDLSPQRLLAAYSTGIFPWYSDDEPIIWWSPDPRFVLFPEEIKISRSMRKVLKRDIFTITYDKCFSKVIEHCQQPRKKQKGTWITQEMKEGYIRLHNLGYAHSVETWQEDELVGGLYGISLGKSFFGESMFSLKADASKTAFIHLAQKLNELNFTIIDCQVYTSHLESLGARNIPRQEFIRIIKQSFQSDTIQGVWGTNRLFTGE